MFEEQDRETGFALFLVIALAIVISIFTLGIAAGTAIGQLGAAATATAGAPSASPVLPARVYFESGKAELPADAGSDLAPVVQAARDGSRTLVVSGFHDATGDLAANAELAKRRAVAVRDLLLSQGVPSERIELRRPALTTGGGEPKMARRVEVSLD